jgi:hypothetical protein
MIIEGLPNGAYAFWKVSLRFRIPLLDLVFTAQVPQLLGLFPRPQAAQVKFRFP